MWQAAVHAAQEILADSSEEDFSDAENFDHNDNDLAERLRKRMKSIDKVLSGTVVEPSAIHQDEEMLKENAEMRLKIKFLQSSASQNKKEMRALSNECEDLARRVQDAEQELQEAKLEDEKRRNTIENLKNELRASESTKEDHDCSKKRVLETEAQIKSLRVDLSLKDEDLARAKTSLKNLEVVLRQFQTKRRRSESSTAKALKTARERAEEAEKRLEDEICKAKRSARDSVKTEISSLTQRADAAERQASVLRKSLTSAMKQVRAMSEDNLVDKRLIAKLLTTYFERGCKFEIMEILCQMVGFDEEECDRIKRLSFQATTGFVPSLFSRFAVSNATETPLKPTSTLKNRRTSSNNFIDMWADFMIKESEKSTEETTGAVSNRRIVRISKEEGEKEECGNDSVLNISLNEDDVTDRQYQLQ